MEEKIKLFEINSKVYTSWDSFERYRWDFLGWIRFINPRSEKDYQLISYFQGFNYKLLDNYDEKIRNENAICIDKYYYSKNLNKKQ